MFIIKDLKYRAVTYASQREKVDDWVTLLSMSVSAMILWEGLWGRNSQMQNQIVYVSITVQSQDQQCTKGIHGWVSINTLD